MQALHFVSFWFIFEILGICCCAKAFTGKVSWGINPFEIHRDDVFSTKSCDTPDSIRHTSYKLSLKQNRKLGIIFYLNL
jgi:hypothetical protein